MLSTESAYQITMLRLILFLDSLSTLWNSYNFWRISHLSYLLLTYFLSNATALWIYGSIVFFIFAFWPMARITHITWVFFSIPLVLSTTDPSKADPVSPPNRDDVLE